MGEKIQLAPGTSIFARDAQLVQFGLDAQRAGVFHCVIGDVSRVVAACNKKSLTTTTLLNDLRAAGLPPQEAAGLLQDLFTHGIIERRQNHRLQLLGSGPIFDCLQQLFKHDTAVAFERITPQPNQSPMQFLAHGDTSTPLVLVSDTTLPREYAAGLRAYDTVIPITHIDGQGIIGPLRLSQQGPCLMCDYLQRCQSDGLWRQHLREVPYPLGIDGATIYATAAYSFALIQSLYQHHLGPGIRLQQPRAGQVTRITAQTQETTVVPTHPLCPECNDRY